MLDNILYGFGGPCYIVRLKARLPVRGTCQNIDNGGGGGAISIAMTTIRDFGSAPVGMRLVCK